MKCSERSTQISIKPGKRLGRPCQPCLISCDPMTVRELTYAQALSEGLCQAMERDPSIFVTGIAVDYPSGIFGSTTEATKRFGPSRVFDAPAMENAMTGIAIGAASMGKRPVIAHPRNDFMFLSFDNLINLAAKWRYLLNGRALTLTILVITSMVRGKGRWC